MNCLRNTEQTTVLSEKADDARTLLSDLRWRGLIGRSAIAPFFSESNPDTVLNNIFTRMNEAKQSKISDDIVCGMNVLWQLISGGPDKI